MNLRARTKGKLQDGKPIGGQGQVTEGNVKQLKSTMVWGSAGKLSPK